MIEHHHALFGHTFIVKCPRRTCWIMTIIKHRHMRVDELFAKLTIHEAAFFLHSSGSEAHEYKILQHIRRSVSIKHNWILTYREIDGIAATLGLLNGTITNDKFCMSRTGHLRLSWWRLPLRAREKVTQAVEYPSEGNNVERCLQEETHEETAMEGSALHSDMRRRSISMGSELPLSCPVEYRGSEGPPNGTFLSGEAR